MYMSIEFSKLKTNGTTNRGKTKVMRYDGLAKATYVASMDNLSNKLR